MNIEKMANSKFYRGFEWFYRLIFLNLLIILVSFSLASIPFLVYYYNQEYGLLLYIIIVLFIIAFIPASITSFIVIKHYADQKTGNVFVLYFRYLIDTVKRVYLIEIFFIPVFLILVYGLYYYWQALAPENYQNDVYGYIAIIAFVIEFFLLIGLFFTYINLNFLIAYFRMKTFHYIKMAIKFSIRYMGETFISGLVLIIPIVLLFTIGVMRFIPIYFILGISLPQFFVYNLVRSRYDYLEKNVDDLDSENKYE